MFVSNVCGFKSPAIGSVVTDENRFMALLIHDTLPAIKFDDKGQSFSSMGKDAWATVSSGVGLATKHPDDYVCREHRGVVSAYLKRSFALPPATVSVVVYTMDAYLNDPDVKDDAKELADARHAADSDEKFVLVALLVGSGPKSPLTPWRFICNMGGGNKRYEVPVDGIKEWAEARVAEAKEIKEYYSKYCVVAD
ncbi:hypothetical protein ACFLQL_02305 [Verrucomicrobiota bacterium]